MSSPAPRRRSEPASGLDFATELWRAFGLPEIDQHADTAFDEQDVETLRAVKAMLDGGDLTHLVSPFDELVVRGAPTPASGW